MKWVLLILIILIILIGFAVWRRMQGAGQPAGTPPPAPPAAPAVGAGSPDEPTLATEGGVDEVTPAPASETPPRTQPPARPTSEHPEDWWQDREGGRPPR